MRKFACLTLLLCAACGEGMLTGPTREEGGSKTVVTEPAVPAATPQPIAQPLSGADCWVGNYGSYHYGNTGSDPSLAVAYWTDFDDQELVRGFQPAGGPVLIAAGGSFDGSFNKTCIQVDVSGVVGGIPYCAGFIDQDGKRVAKIDEAIRRACTPQTPTPQPTPSPEPSPEPTPSPTPSPSPSPSPTPTPSPTPSPSPTPEPTVGCYYNVPDNGANDGKVTCEATPGFLSWNPQNHLCQIAAPGWCDKDFKLNKGQSGACRDYTQQDQTCSVLK